jgi:hypothetical protein
MTVTASPPSLRRVLPLRVAIALTCALAPIGPALAQAPAPAPAPQTAPATAETSAPLVSAEAIERLNAMGAYLRSLKAFTVTADVTSDLVLDSGQKIETAQAVQMSARIPDKLYIDASSAVRHRQIYYNGKTVTIYAEKLKYYGSFPAPATIAATVTAAADKYGLEVPLADLFLWGTSASDTKAITEAFFIGPQRVGGVLCQQFAFRQPGVDWQVCIEPGKAALPRKLIVTSTDEDGQPQHRSVLTWKTGASLADSKFTFVPPKGATPIAVSKVGS